MLEIKNISKHYSGFSLEKVSLQINQGNYYVLLGPSGAGKTQLLEIIAGLVTPDEGSILDDNSDITSLPGSHRPVGIVFQDQAVFPHISVESNIAYPLKGMGIKKREVLSKVEEMAERLGILSLLHRRPSSLSGGELQRVALARTLVRKPKYLLLDEPMSSLDVQIRQDLFNILKGLHRGGQTILHVTHDFEETMVLATHVSVMNKGRIIQSGTAEEVFHRPGSEFVARFTGIKNYFPANLVSINSIQIARLKDNREIKLSSEENDGEGYVMIPGEEIIISRSKIESSATNQWKGVVEEIFHVPGGMEIMVDAGVPLYVRVTPESVENLHVEHGSEVWLSFKASGVRFIKA